MSMLHLTAHRIKEMHSHYGELMKAVGVENAPGAIIVEAMILASDLVGIVNSWRCCINKDSIAATIVYLGNER